MSYFRIGMANYVNQAVFSCLWAIHSSILALKLMCCFGNWGCNENYICCCCHWNYRSTHTPAHIALAGFWCFHWWNFHLSFITVNSMQYYVVHTHTLHIQIRNTRNKQERDKATTVSILCIGACEHCKMYGTINHKVHKHIDRARLINSHQLCAAGGPEPRQKWKLVFCHCHCHCYTHTHIERENVREKVIYLCRRFMILGIVER